MHSAPRGGTGQAAGRVVPMQHSPWRSSMAYLRCPECGITVFDRNPLVSPGRCPRCAVRGDTEIYLERVLQLRGGAAGSVMDVATALPTGETDTAPEAPA